MKPTHLPIVAAVVLGGFVLLSASLVEAPSGYGDEPKFKGDVYSAIHCIGCHGGPDTPAYKAYLDEKPSPTLFVKLTEYTTWHEEDIHAKAFANIDPDKASLARRMQDVLAGASGRRADYHVQQEPECLTCHAVDRNPGPLANATLQQFHTRYGVSCEACHGFAGNWIGPHVQASWREVSPADKEKLGEVDLRDPYIRAKTCASCHIGDKAQGKFVTHEMYAAGHPPLPPFELVTYCKDEPAHYFPHGQNKAIAAMKPEQRAQFYFRDPSTECLDASDLTIGTVAAFEASMNLLEKEAAEAAKSGSLLDFAHFDCYACHHDLKAKSERVQPRPGLQPGRPTTRPTDLLQVIWKHGQSDSFSKLNAQLEELHAAFASRPFGDAAAVSAAAKKLAGLCSGARGEWAKVQYTPETTVELYKLLAARMEGASNADHDTAQQFAWAIEVLQDDLRAGKEPTPAVKAARAKLNDIVALRLRGKPGEAIAPRVPARQAEIGAFQPGKFRQQSKEWLRVFDAK